MKISAASKPANIGSFDTGTSSSTRQPMLREVWNNGEIVVRGLSFADVGIATACQVFQTLALVASIVAKKRDASWFLCAKQVWGPRTSGFSALRNNIMK